MPRYRSRIRPLSKSSALSTLEELALTWWGAPLVSGMGCETPETMGRCWREHGDAVLRRWIECRPGTRPACMYYLDLIPLPPVKWPQASLSFVFGDRRVYPQWNYFGHYTGKDDHIAAGGNYGEFIWLRSQGVVGDTEARRAEEWIDDRHYDPGWREPDYRSLATT